MISIGSYRGCTGNRFGKAQTGASLHGLSVAPGRSRDSRRDGRPASLRDYAGSREILALGETSFLLWGKRSRVLLRSKRNRHRLCASVRHRRPQPGKASYCWKRFRRIYPIYWVILLGEICLYLLIPSFGNGAQDRVAGSPLLLRSFAHAERSDRLFRSRGRSSTR